MFRRKGSTIELLYVDDCHHFKMSKIPLNDSSDDEGAFKHPKDEQEKSW